MADDPKQAARNASIWLLVCIRKTQWQSSIPLQHPTSTMVRQLSSLSVLLDLHPTLLTSGPENQIVAHWQITFTACSAQFQDICGSRQDTLNSVWLPLFAVAYSKGIQTASFLLFFLLHLFLIFNNFSHFCSFFWAFSGVYSFPKSHSARSCQLTKADAFSPLTSSHLQ